MGAKERALSSIQMEILYGIICAFALFEFTAAVLCPEWLVPFAFWSIKYRVQVPHVLVSGREKLPETRVNTSVRCMTDFQTHMRPVSLESIATRLRTIENCRYRWGKAHQSLSVVLSTLFPQRFLVLHICFCAEGDAIEMRCYQAVPCLGMIVLALVNVARERFELLAVVVVVGLLVGKGFEMNATRYARKITGQLRDALEAERKEHLR